MEDIAGICSRADSLLASDETLIEHLPVDVRDRVLRSSGLEYFDALACAARICRCTDRLFDLYRPVWSELASRWVSRKPIDVEYGVSTISSLARLLPLTTHLRSLTITALADLGLDRTVSAYTQALSTEKGHEAHLIVLLLALFRLLSFDRDFSDRCVSSAWLASLFQHESLVVRYLAILVFCQVMHRADAFEEELLRTHLESRPILGKWEGKNIDFRLLRLWEERRWKDLQSSSVISNEPNSVNTAIISKPLLQEHLSPDIALVGSTLVPREGRVTQRASLMTLTSTTTTNLNNLARALLRDKPIVLCGPAGCGKTSLVLEAARLVNKLETMVTLHLNDQTDSKSLTGYYTSSSEHEGFVWRPGVITTALEQGRWVLVEDIDKISGEVLGVLRPVIETGSLYLPNRKQTIRGKEGFRLLGTVRASNRAELLQNRIKISWLGSEEAWSIMEVAHYTLQETFALLNARFPAIATYVPTVLRAHSDLLATSASDADNVRANSRRPALRDLLKWCQRIEQRIDAAGLSSLETVPQSLQLDILKDGLDCYASHLSDSQLYHKAALILMDNLKLSPALVDHHLRESGNLVEETTQAVKVGSVSLVKVISKSPRSSRHPFANTPTAKAALSGIAATVCFAEPCLLVGETGVGKTMAIQHLAELTGQKLTVVNLSQQSEASDLLGGLKPVTVRSLMLPLADEFMELFENTFPESNDHFKLALEKALYKQNWQRMLKLWQEACDLSQKTLRRLRQAMSARRDAAEPKRRKLDLPSHQQLDQRWHRFSNRMISIANQVKRGDNAQTFAFVEGRMLQAVRNGDWLLLDEINLAPSETLDHIANLLGEVRHQTPFVLLTEAGDMEKVEAHPNFRVFAAMNPATDTGKKDLAQSIRSRFTEHYIHSGDKALGDLVQLVKTYLGKAISNDKHAMVDIAKAYLHIQSCCQQHRLVDGAGENPHYSIRTLVRCLLYIVQHHTSIGLRRAMYEGFAMSFFTILSHDSQALISPAITKIVYAEVRNPGALMAQAPRMNSAEENQIAFKHHVLRRGPLTPDFQPHYIRTPSVERNLLSLARAASMHRFPILLQGPTSSGKTSMVEYLAKLSGHKFVRINNHEHTDLQEYLGIYASGQDGRLVFREGVLVSALREGHWLVLDELNLAPSDVLEALNRLLDDNRELIVPETQEIVRPHPDFMLFATQNPAGLYGGRKRLSRAFRNRFLEIHFNDLPEDELETILRQRSQIAPSFCSQIVAVYKKLSLLRQSSRLFETRNSFATLRDLFRWASRKFDDRQELAQHGFMLLAERVRDSNERQIVKETIEETLKVTLNEDDLFSISKIPETCRLEQRIVWTASMRRLYVLISEALRNKEPVLLVGETGCGKTQICQVVAHAFEKPLNMYNAHSNTETSDLIGSQRPVRSRVHLVRDVLDSLQAAGGSNGDTLFSEDDTNIDSLITNFRAMDTSIIEPRLVSRVEESIGAYLSLFNWSDGSLVRSMRKGEHFLLDEISLADDSVLERLNSLLEPSRTILLAEKGSFDNIVVAHSDFQFLATMNPGGDYGKRELSAALRNRMTEIWVPSLSQETDLQPIVQARLGSLDAKYAGFMLSFAAWFSATFQEDSSHPQLRNLLAWCAFVHSVGYLESEVALVHGAALVYMDGLGASPAGMQAQQYSSVDEARRRCIERLQIGLSVDVKEVYEAFVDLSLDRRSLSVGSFRLERQADCDVPTTSLNLDAPTTRKNMLRIVRALQMDRSILLEGDPGVGKTAMVTSLAEMLGKSFTRVNLSDQTDLMDLFGADAPSTNEALGKFVWTDGPLLQAMEQGGWILLDEMNLASQSVLEGLNACLDHRKEVYVAELDRTFVCHPEFRLFAAQNPHSQGGGRKGLPASFTNRFTVVYVEKFEELDLLAICKPLAAGLSQQAVESIIQNAAKVDHELRRNPTFSEGGPWDLNLRDIGRWIEMARYLDKLDPRYHFRTIVMDRLRNRRQREQILHSLPLLSTIDQESVYHRLSPDMFQVGLAWLARDRAMQHVVGKRALPLEVMAKVKSIITGINHRWPVVLVGGSGSSKLDVIKSLAALSGARLLSLSMNSDMDTADILGGFEQYDEARMIVSAKDNIEHHVDAQISKTLIQDPAASVHPLLNLHQTCRDPHASPETLHQTVLGVSGQLQDAGVLLDQLQLIMNQRKLPAMRFVWNDGPLVDAVLQGAWLVLEHANICNPSVLDRLNSLLEPSGQLMISEQHGSDGGMRTIRPHPDFRVFLTVDPKYGELSRAMRNRSLEVFMDDCAQAPGSTCPIEYPLSSSIARLQALDGGGDGITGEPPSEADLAPKEVAILESQSYAADLVLDGIRSYRVSQARDLRTDIFVKHFAGLGTKDLPFTQNDGPQHPVMNEPLLLRQMGTELKEVAPAICIAREMSLLCSNIRYHLEETSNGSTARRLRSRNLADAVLNMQQAFDTFMSKVNDALTSSWVSSSLSSMNMEQMRSARQIGQWLHLALQLRDTNENDRARFKAFFDAGRILSCQRSACVGPVSKLFASSSDQFESITLRYGQSLQILWESWRPPTPSNQVQLETRLTLEQMCSDFDTLLLQLPHSRYTLSKIKLELIKAATYGWNTPDPRPLVTNLANSLQSLSKSTSQNEPVPNHYQKIFDILHCKVRSISGRHRQFLIDKVNPFTASKLMITDGVETSRPSYALSMLSGLSDCLDSEIQRLSGAIITQTLKVDTQPLLAFERLREETEALARTICSGATNIVASSVPVTKMHAERLVSSILEAHREFVKPKSSNLTAQDAITGEFSISTLVSARDHALSTILQAHLNPAVLLLKDASSSSQVRVSTAGALYHISMAGLKLIVPDKPFDPVLLPQVMKNVHQVTKSFIMAQCKAHAKFNRDIMGQTTSLLQRVYEDELLRLGNGPPTPAVVRPSQNELRKVQEVFDQIIRNVVEAIPSTVFGADLKLTDSFMDAWPRLRSAIELILERLGALNRAYDDIVVPVKQLLNCLCLSIRMVSDTPNDNTDQASSLRKLPLMGGKPSDQTTWSLLHESTAGMGETSLRYCCLHAQAGSWFPAPMRDSPRPAYLMILDSLYESWKIRLEKDQAQAEKKEKYYSYRGEDQVDEADAREVAEMFPTYDDAHDPGSDSVVSDDSSQVANRVALLHEKLFSKGWSGEELQGIIVSELSRFGYQNSRLDSALPGIILLLQKAITDLNAEQPSRRINIYSDASIADTKKLLTLTAFIRNRFFEINAKWPEHSVPLEVLAFTKDLLKFPLDIPIAKMLTKTEKLLEIVSQWQSVAGREWSVAALIEDLTALIISWRRLELTSWSRLLEEEKQKSDAAARSWYFIAYEAVLYNTRSMADSNEDVRKYTESLCNTLEQFLGSTSLGQFSPRLHMLSTMCTTLVELGDSDERLTPVVAGVQNVISHYERYEADIQNRHDKGYDELQKAVNEQIKLASWKDTNVTSLRDSSKRSHNKLFRIVKKYRTLLARPVGVLKSSPAVIELDAKDGKLLQSTDFAPNYDLHDSQQLCLQQIREWDARPSRLKDTMTARNTMRQIYEESKSLLEIDGQLSAMQDDLSSSIRELRSQTPSSLTKENGAEVRHLQERKRKLLSETIRQIAHMGIRRNLATAELEMQASTAVVLAHTPDTSKSHQFSGSNAAFHDLIDDMPQVRAASAQHSQDLTSGEMRRCVGHLEGLLSVVLKQRSHVSKTETQLHGLEAAVTMMKTVCDSAEHIVVGKPDPASLPLYQRMSWLPAILAVSCNVLEFQRDKGQLQIGGLIEVISKSAGFLKETQDRLRTLWESYTLPTGLLSQKVISEEKHIWEHLQKLRNHLESWQQQEQNIAYLVKQIIPWTEYDQSNEGLDQRTNGDHVHDDIDGFDQALRSCTDSIFVALQNLAELKDKKELSYEDAGWLLQHDKRLQRSVAALHIDDISASLANVMAKIQRQDPQDFWLIAALTQVVYPIFEQYLSICRDLFDKETAIHQETCQLASFLARSFNNLAADGFCSPADGSTEQEQSGNLEGGTGLGEGEGANDISKDVGADEDMSEFAQNGEKQDAEGEISDVEDAVDMGKEDLEGEMGDAGETKDKGEGDGDDQDDDESGDEMDEEAGSVDDLDPTAVDEKLWDEAVKEQKEQDKELKSDKQKGEKGHDQTEKQDGKAEDASEGEISEGKANEDEEIEDQEVGDGKAEAEHADPHLQEEKALELPEEMQLNGEDEAELSDISDADMEDLSDVEQPTINTEEVDVEEEGAAQEEANDAVDQPPANDDPEADSELPDGKADIDELIEDQPSKPDNDTEQHGDRREGETTDTEVNGGETGAANQVQDDIDTDQKEAGQNEESENQHNQPQTSGGRTEAKEDNGDSGRSMVERGAGRNDQAQRPQEEALRRLADVLEQWHQRREIYNPSEEQQSDKLDDEVNMAEADLEHVDDEAATDTQALGSADADQTQNVDPSKAIKDETTTSDDDVPMPDVREQEQEEASNNKLNRLQASQVNEPRDDGDTTQDTVYHGQVDNSTKDMDPRIETTEHMSPPHRPDSSLDALAPSPPASRATVTDLWSYCSNQVHTSSLHLTEQLRLILSPTTATKLRGDYRTGKRLNIKRIIPYIASSYKRDKIWLRRSHPSKRQYQVLLAVDDSQSMSESSTDLLALQTTALLCKSLSALEVGDISVIAFGDSPQVSIAHDFATPWTNNSGPEVFSRFSFAQKGTNVKSMVFQSLTLLREARLKSTASNASELWQLQLIISDGHCSDHDAIRQLVRQAKSERIVMVFVIVDSPAAMEVGRGGESILEMKEAVFEADDREGREGEMRVVTRRYLEGFPFEYYLVVRDVRDLPGVLARCLRGWMERVVEN